MTTLNILLKDNIINKSELINKRHEYLGLDSAKAAILTKIFVAKNENLKVLTLERISELTELEIEAVKLLVKSLIVEGLVTMENIDGASSFNFEVIIDKLLATYLPPKDNSPIETKIAWIERETTLDGKNETLLSLIKSTDWKKVISVVEVFKNQKEKTIPLFISLIESTIESSKKQDENIKSILEINWLEQ